MENQIDPKDFLADLTDAWRSCGITPTSVTENLISSWVGQRIYGESRMRAVTASLSMDKNSLAKLIPAKYSALVDDADVFVALRKLFSRLPPRGSAPSRKPPMANALKVTHPTHRQAQFTVHETHNVTPQVSHQPGVHQSSHQPPHQPAVPQTHQSSVYPINQTARPVVHQTQPPASSLNSHVNFNQSYQPKAQTPRQASPARKSLPLGSPPVVETPPVSPPQKPTSLVSVAVPSAHHSQPQHVQAHTVQLQNAQPHFQPQTYNVEPQDVQTQNSLSPNADSEMEKKVAEVRGLELMEREIQVLKKQVDLLKQQLEKEKNRNEDRFVLGVGYEAVISKLKQEISAIKSSVDVSSPWNRIRT
jgi:hypothetical protein